MHLAIITKKFRNRIFAPMLSTAALLKIGSDKILHQNFLGVVVPVSEEPGSAMHISREFKFHIYTALNSAVL